MPITISVPQLGESVVEGTITKWLKNVGDSIREEEPLVEIMTDKITIEVPSPGSGTLAKILVESGTVPIGEKIAYMLKAGETAADLPADGAPSGPASSTAHAAPKPAAPAPASAPSQSTATAVAVAPAPAPRAPMPAPSTGTAGGNGHARYSPVVRRLAKEHEVDPAWVKGSGLGGRVTRDDMIAYIADLRAGKVAPPMAGGGGSGARTGLPTTGPMEETIPLAGVRKAIADKMVQSKFTAVHTSTFEEVDMSAIVRLRKAHKDRLAKEGVKLTFTPFFVKAATLALREFPTMNATWNGAESVTVKRYYNIGVAVGRDKGLIVPVLKDCGGKSLVDLAKGVEDLATRAHGDKLTMDDLQGGTFSITNAGLFGSTGSTPIINFPEVAILGIHKIADKPIAVDGQVVIRPVMNVACTFDHRWIDGHTAVQFLVRVKSLLEQPELLWFVA